jgi:hypothetical protein
MISGIPLIRMSVEVQCWPLWIIRDCSADNVDPLALGLSQQLSADLLAWQKSYEDIFDWSYPPDTHWPTEVDEAEFAAVGRSLAVRLRTEVDTSVRIELIERVRGERFVLNF